jgi:serine protease Do
LQKGDVITAVADRTVASRLDYELALIDYSAGVEIPINVERDGEPLAAKLSVGKNVSSTHAQFTSASSVQDQVFRSLGVRLEPADPNKVRSIDATYKGGLKVTSVRSNSPADKAQIRAGDTLVGLMEWQTPNWDDLAWILKSSEFQGAKSPKFHIMRGTEVFWGSLDIDMSNLR